MESPPKFFTARTGTMAAPNDAKNLICSMAGCSKAGKYVYRGMIFLQGMKYLQDPTGNLPENQYGQ
jgi:hypothetical protein